MGSQLAGTHKQSVQHSEAVLARNLTAFDIWLRDGLLLGIEPSPDVFAITVVYFVQGALGIARLATSFFLKDELGLTPAQSAALLGITAIPWVIKPVYGFVSDSIPLFGYRRKSYLALAGLVGSCAWVVLGLTPHPDPRLACTCLTVTSLGVAVSDVVVDSIVVAKAREIRESPPAAARGSQVARSTETNAAAAATEEQSSTEGALQSLCWGSSSIGSILSAYSGGALLQVVSAQTVFLGAAAFPLLVAAISPAIQEQPLATSTTTTTTLNTATARVTTAAFTADGDSNVAKESPDDSLLQSPGGGTASTVATPPPPHGVSPLSSSSSLESSLRTRVDLLWSAVSEKSVWLPAAFLFAWKASPSADQAFFYFATSELGFTPEFLGRVSLVGAVASLGGVVAYQKWLKAMAPSQVLKWTTLLGLPPALLQLALITHLNRDLGISDEWFTLTDDAVLAALGQIGFMPTLVIAARLCPPGVEGTLFALLMSVYNGAGLVGQELGALLTAGMGVTESDFTNLAPLVALCSLSSLLPLPFLGVLRDVEEEDPGGGASGGAV